MNDRNVLVFTAASGADDQAKLFADLVTPACNDEGHTVLLCSNLELWPTRQPNHVIHASEYTDTKFSLVPQLRTLLERANGAPVTVLLQADNPALALDLLAAGAANVLVITLHYINGRHRSRPMLVLSLDHERADPELIRLAKSERDRIDLPTDPDRERPYPIKWLRTALRARPTEFVYLHDIPLEPLQPDRVQIVARDVLDRLGVKRVSTMPLWEVEADSIAHFTERGFGVVHHRESMDRLRTLDAGGYLTAYRCGLAGYMQLVHQLEAAAVGPDRPNGLRVVPIIRGELSTPREFPNGYDDLTSYYGPLGALAVQLYQLIGP